MDAVIVWTCFGIIVIFFLGLFCGTTRWFDTLMRNIGDLLRGK